MPMPIPNDGPTLPSELVSKIFAELQQDRQYAALAKMAQVHSKFYDLVIPILYETITITETNWRRLRMGHGDRNPEYVELKALNMFLSTARAGDGTCPHRQLGEGGPPSRKDKAVRHCRRLIIDIVTSLFSIMFALNQRWVCQAYGTVEEVNITRHNLDSHRSDANLGLPPDDSPCIVWPGMNVKTITPRRFVMYAPIRPRGVVSQQINVFHRSRQENRYFQSCHGPTPDASLAYADIHFVSDYAMSRRDIAIKLARWIVWDHRTSTNREEFRIRLFDIPSLIIDEADRPKNKAEATELARRKLERMFNKHHKVAGRQKLVRGIMDRIDFMESGDGDDEYPVLRPRAVSQIPRGSCSQS